MSAKLAGKMKTSKCAKQFVQSMGCESMQISKIICAKCYCPWWTLDIVLEQGHAIGNGFDFDNSGTRNRIDFHDLGIKNE